MVWLESRSMRARSPGALRANFLASLGRDVLVAVIDSGWDRHLCDERILTGIDLVAASPSCSAIGADHDLIGHGTECCQRILEIAPSCRIVPIRVFDRATVAPISRITRALQCAASLGARVANLSMSTTDTTAINQLYRGCAEAEDAGLIVVAAAQEGARLSYPSAFEPVIGVERGIFHDPLDFSYSEDGPTELIADGSGMGFGTAAGKPWSGSSYSAARASGFVCRILERRPCLSLADVRRHLRSIGSFYREARVGHVGVMSYPPTTGSTQS